MAPQMLQGRHFPGDPPADQFPDSVLDVFHLQPWKVIHVIQLFNELIFDQRFYVVLLKYMYRLYLVWSTKLHMASKAMRDRKLHFHAQVACPLTLRIMLCIYVFMHLCVYEN